MAHAPTRSEKHIAFFWKVHTLLLGGVLALPLLVSAPAEAASCKSLARQLSSRASTGSQNPHVKTQRRHIRIIEKRMRRAGCGSGRSGKSACRTNRLLLKKMQRNLAQLQRRYGGAPVRSKASISRAMRQQGCNRTASLHQKIFEKTKRARTRKKASPHVSRKDTHAHQNRSRYSANTVSTYCVREADGFYVPISFSTSPRYFKRDRAKCETRCPGVPMRLYYHKTNGEFPEDMVAASDERRYADLPTAFAFQQQPRQLQCDFSKVAKKGTVETVAGDIPQRTLTQIAALARPTFRPDTRLLRGSLVPPKPPAPTAQGRIRVVGDAFFPVQ